jgi:hypothetical protein
MKLWMYFFYRDSLFAKTSRTSVERHSLHIILLYVVIYSFQSAYKETTIYRNWRKNLQFDSMYMTNSYLVVEGWARPSTAA